MKPVPPLFASGIAREERVARLWAHRRQFEQYWRLKPGRPWKSAHTLPLSPRARVAMGLLRSLGLARRGWRNACSPLLREWSLHFNRLPRPLDGFRILHLSDLHYPPAAEDFTQGVTRLVAAVAADLCVLTGDYRFGRGMLPGPAMEHLAALMPRLQSRHGVFAVLGNHDLGDMVPDLEAMGVTVLVNRGRGLDLGGACLWIAGVDDPHMFRCADPEAAMAGAPAAAFKLFLAHTPEVYAGAAALGAQLYLCGHTHAGQVRLPRVGAIHTNARCPRAYTAGLWRHGGMQGYTSAGLGVTEVPVRFHCPPEAALITLRRADLMEGEE